MERVVITGIGLATPCGGTRRETWDALIEGRSGVASITSFDASEYPVRIAAEVKGFSALDHFKKTKAREMGRFAQLAVVAARECMADAAIEMTEEDHAQCGTFIGVGLGGLEYLYQYSRTLDEKGPKRVSPYFIPQVISNLAGGQAAMDLNLRGPSYATTSACASSAHAIGDAADWIRLGRTPLMLAGGAEATVTGLGIAGFAAMFALSKRNDEPERASRPWDRGRDGFVVGEGAGVLLLESLSHARKRGAKIYAEVSGYGASCDAFHITRPAPDGEGAVRAMNMALSSAGLAADAIDYINAHGTSTPAGDVEEAKALLALFGEHARSKKLWVSSTKSAMGHLLGGAGGVEAAICALALREGKVPPTLNLDDPEPDLPLDFVPHEARERPIAHAMSNSFGFGGTNATLIMSRVDD